MQNKCEVQKSLKKRTTPLDDGGRNQKARRVGNKNFTTIKKALPFIFLSLFFFKKEDTFSQSATSTGNGNWTNPAVWSCNCIPFTGYTIVINHNITLDTDFAYSSGSITINGSLIDDNTGRDLWVYGTGFLTNNGTLDVKNFLYQGTGDPYMNNGTTTAIALTTTTITNNSGSITTDSLYNTGTFTDSATATIIADSVTNAGTFINNGTITFNQFTNTATFTNNNLLNFTDFTNNATFNNADSLMGANSFWNTGIFNNSSGSYFQINNDFLNDDLSLNDAVFTNNGILRVLDSWYNADTVKGTTGRFFIADTSYNSGQMKGTFDFCDLTPPSSAPFIDFNLGFIAPSITWCVTGVNEIADKALIHIFPNPTFDKVTVSSLEKINAIEIYNMLGESVNTINNFKQQTLNEINLSNFQQGIYFVKIYYGTKIYNRKIVLQ